MIHIACRAAAEYAALDVSVGSINAMFKLINLAFRALMRGKNAAGIGDHSVLVAHGRFRARGFTSSDKSDCLPRRHLALRPRSMDTQANYDHKGK